MGKIQVSAIRRPKPSTFRRTFSDPKSPDLPPFELELRRLSTMDLAAASDRGREYSDAYSIPAGSLVPKIALAPIDGQAVIPSPSACRVAAILEMAQVCSTLDDRESFETILSAMASEALSDQFVEAVEEISKGPEADGERQSPLAWTPGSE